ncbi:hypothetical protein VitviT2T_030665 [Vitis vinifera]|uniref:Uncharacterized protein n=1 Tax=Vitis vinifera TaxID=29760 RepID=A0ABY9E1E6_VITVI|nr:hypothetical protein VitviT2T_030665 [Vitis vinifera]
MLKCSMCSRAQCAQAHKALKLPRRSSSQGAQAPEVLKLPSLPSQFEYDVVVMVLFEIKMEVMGNGKHDALEGNEETKEIEELVSLVIVETSIDINSECT